MAGATTTKVPLLDLSRQWKSLEKAVLDEAYCGTPHAVACASGTDAILLSLRGLGVGHGDEVVTSPFTFFATAGAIWNCGARPVFADIEPDSFNIDPRAAAAAVTPRTKAVVPVHLFGRCADMAGIIQFTAKRRIAVVEDMAQAIGAEYRGLKAGAMGDAGTLSFYPSKNLGGAGDGGMVVTPWKELDGRLRMARNHGQGERYEHHFVGTNSRLDGLQAAVLRAKLAKLDAWSDARAAHAAKYDALLKGVPGVRTPPTVPAKEGRHVYNQYTIRCEKRDALREHLTKREIGSAVYYPIPLHLQRCFAPLGGKKGQFPQSELAAAEVLSLPVFPELTEAEQDTVVKGIREFYGRK